MTRDINNLLNEFLYKSTSKQGEEYDIKIYNSVSSLLKNFDQNSFLLDKTNFIRDEMNFNYDLDSDRSYKEYFGDWNYLDYFGGSLSESEYGLQKSQLKSLTALLKTLRTHNLFSINGAPGTGKSTILNYVISNILIGELIRQYNNAKKYKNHNMSFTHFLTNVYKIPKIFLTGQTKNAVKNISEISKIKFPDRHKWISSKNEKVKEEIDNIFNSWDIHLPEGAEDKLNETCKQYSLSNIDKDEIVNNFMYKAYLYFNRKVNWNEIPELLYWQLSSNISTIKSINEIVKNSISGKPKDVIDYYINLFKLQNKITHIKEIFTKQKEKKFKRERTNQKLLDFYNECFKFIEDVLKINIDSRFKVTTKFKDKYNSVINKPKKLSKWIIKSVNEIEHFVHSANKFREAQNYFNKLNYSLREFGKIFTKEELKELSLNKQINISNVLSEETLGDVIMTLDIIKINFNNIQQKLDIYHRTENSFLFRHICEWLFLNRLINLPDWKSTTIKDLQPIKPIISSNLQDFSFNSVISKIMNVDWKSKSLEPFDFVILDEASQVSWKYIPFLLTGFKKIIVVGDEKQLPAINDNKLVINALNKYSDYEKIAIQSALSQLELFDFNKNEPVFNSVLEWINHKSKITSSLVSNDNNETKIAVKPGLYLLEHMRCPPHMFNLCNNFFYDNSLTYNKPISHECCSFSKYENLLCNQMTYIQLTYDYDKLLTGKNENLKEINIALNFIVDNINNFIAHKYKDNVEINDSTINYLLENLYFISFYNNQNDAFKEITSLISSYLSDPSSSLKINNNEISEKQKIAFDIVLKINKNFNNTQKQYITKFFNEIRYGTVDATQGIGADFIIVSNVSEEIYSKEKNPIKTEFENNGNRINVLWSRTKQHFIQIIANKYMDSKDLVNTKKLSNSSIQGFNGRVFAEESISKNYNRIVFDIDFKKLNNDLSIQNLWNINKYKNDIKELLSKISHIGKYGETIFKTLTDNKIYSKILTSKVSKELGWKIKFYKNVKWENEETESNKEFDFSINNEQYFVDIKSSIRNGRSVFLSKREEEFAQEHKQNYFIAKINDISKFNLNIRNESSIYFILNKISFYKLNDENKFTNKSDSTIDYELR